MSRTFEPSIVEGIIHEDVIQEDGTVLYRVLTTSLGSGTTLDARPLKLLKTSFSRYKKGDNVICLKMPLSNAGMYILGAKETFRDNPPRLTDISDTAISNDYGEIGVTKPEKEGLYITQNGSGFKINNFSEDSNLYSYFDNKVSYTSSGFTYSGKAKLVFDSKDNDNYLSNNTSNKYGFNFDFHKNEVLGEYGGEEIRVPGILYPYVSKPVVFTRSVYNHSDNNWQGVDKEFSKIGSFSDSIPESDKTLKNINARTNFSYNLDLAPNQIGEVIWGNVFDLNGSIIDSNYGSLKNFKPKSEEKYYTHQETRSRGIGYHFQLSTYNNSDLDYSISDNFIASINKEGLLYLNVPSTSDTGMIPYEVDVSFNSNPFSKTRIESSPAPVATEKVPCSNNVMISTSYEAKDGSIVDFNKYEPVPSVTALGGNFERQSGVGVYKLNAYNKNSNSVSRVKMTKHHNMYAAAETLFANKIVGINSPERSTNLCGIATGNTLYKSFEFPQKFYATAESGETTAPKYMSVVITNPDKPAINTGGGVPACGMTAREIGDKPLSNFFQYDGKNKVYPEEATRAGNISAKMNFEGSVIASVGRDKHDEKSIMMDCAGSMICWLGKDKRGRSAVIQTDGDVALNVGGRSGNSFNKGRLDIRVNVNDKGTVEDANDKIRNKSEKAIGDFVISISEAGLVIAGMAGKPMIIRNDEDLILESATGNVKINSGASIIKKEGFLNDLNISDSPKEVHDKISPFCNIQDQV